MPLYLAVLVVDLEDDEHPTEADSCNRVEPENGRGHMALTTAPFCNQIASRVVMRARRQGNVHAQGADNDHERANRLEHAHVHPKPKVRGHEQD